MLLILFNSSLCQKNLYSAWNGISKLRESVIAKRHELQLLQHKLKLASVLKSQVRYLDAFFSPVVNPIILKII